ISRASCAATRRAWYCSRSLCGICVPDVSISCTNLAERCKSRMASSSFHRSLEALTLFLPLFLPYRLSRSSVLYFVLAFYPPDTLATLKSLRLLPRERVSSIHRASEKAHSRKPGLPTSSTYLNRLGRNCP